MKNNQSEPTPPLPKPLPMDWRSQLRRRIESDTRSQSQLSRDSGVSRASIQFYISGGRREPRVSSLFGLMSALYGEDMEHWYVYYSAMIAKEMMDKNRQKESNPLN